MKTIWMLIRERDRKGHAPSAYLREAAARGHEIIPILPRECALDLGDGGFGVVHAGRRLTLPHCVLNYRVATGTSAVFALSRQLEAAGVRVINSTRASELGRDKAASLQIVAAAGLPVPRTTLIAPNSLAHADPELHFPVVVKAATGGNGEQVYSCRSRAELHEVLETIRRTPKRRDTILLQEFIETSPVRDLRVSVVGGRVIGAVYRHAAPGEWKTNVTLGARTTECPIDDEISRISLGACKLLGLDFAGVDLLIGPNGYLFSEANPAPGFRLDHDPPRSYDIPKELFDFIESL